MDGASMRRQVQKPPLVAAVDLGRSNTAAWTTVGRPSRACCDDDPIRALLNCVDHQPCRRRRLPVPTSHSEQLRIRPPTAALRRGKQARDLTCACMSGGKDGSGLTDGGDHWG